MATEARNYANCRNAPNSGITPNKPPIVPKLSTKMNIIITNKANFPESQMNVNKVLTKDYENKTLGERGKNKANSKPNKANFKGKKMLPWLLFRETGLSCPIL